MWHPKTVSSGVKQTLTDLEQRHLLENFYLAGGTGLTLHLGHRRSLDLDFFSTEPFDEERLLGQVQRFKEFSLVARNTQTLHTHVRGTRVTFLHYAYPLLFSFELFEGVKVADPLDIACMKISAISSIGAKRDFIDFYVVAKQYGIVKVLDLFQKKFEKANYNRIHVLKSLVYFDEAEKDPMPGMLIEISWQEVKEFFQERVPPLLQ